MTKRDRYMEVSLRASARIFKAIHTGAKSVTLNREELDCLGITGFSDVAQGVYDSATDTADLGDSGDNAITCRRLPKERGVFVMVRKTTWADTNLPECEERRYQAFHGDSRHGKSTMIIKCPFCESRVTAYLWSIRGGGKRCGCGALLGSSGTAYKIGDKQ